MKKFLVSYRMTLIELKIIITIILVSTLFTCSKDESNSDIGQNESIIDVKRSELIGEWSLYSLIVYSTFDFDNDGIASNELIDQNDCFIKLLHLNEDGSFFLHTKYYLDIYNNEIHDYACINSIETGDWILYKNDLILSSPRFEFRIRVRVQGNFLIMEDTVPEVVISEIFELIEEE